MSSPFLCTDVEVAPCLRDGPLAEGGNALINATRRLGASQAASVLRAWCVAHVFAQREAIFDSQEDPTPALASALARTADCIESFRRCGMHELGALGEDVGPSGPVENVTGEHYGKLFQAFSAESYWEESARLLGLRLARNAVDVELLRGKSVLDAGCGGGRYTGAWRLLGAGSATGVDISPINIQDARARAAAASITNLDFREGNVLALDLADESYDVVFSNGVLHHTTDWQQGIRELVRVLRPGGLGYLYLIENPGGLFWDSIEILRVVTAGENRDAARAALRLLNIPGNRIFYVLDHVLVPINVRLTPLEIERCLSDAGAIGIRRLERGVDFDRIERIYQREPYAVQKFGVGENRYVFSKS